MRVVALNVLLENHRSKAAVKFLRDSGADVIAVEEISSWWADRLAALRDIYPYMAPPTGADDSSILISAGIRSSKPPSYSRRREAGPATRSVRYVW